MLDVDSSFLRDQSVCKVMCDFLHLHLDFRFLRLTISPPSLTMAPAVVAHTTPPLAPLPASDAESLQLLGTLKLAGVDAGLMTAEWSANGKPFVTFDGIGVSKRDFPSLPGYADPDSALSAEQKADSVEWQTYIDGRVADLVVSGGRRVN